MAESVPPPWDLTGSAFVLPFRFTRRFIERNGFLSGFMEPRFSLGFGAVLFADYSSSPVGPYQELAFVPGRVVYQGKRYYTVSRIYVSSEPSRENGRENWGLDKELARFEIERQGSHAQRIRAFAGDALILEMRLRWGHLPLPISTMPYAPTLLQEHGGRTYQTKIHGRGRASFGHLRYVKADDRYFPDISLVKPITLVRLTDLSLHLPSPRVSLEIR